MATGIFSVEGFSRADITLSWVSGIAASANAIDISFATGGQATLRLAASDDTYIVGRYLQELSGDTFMDVATMDDEGLHTIEIAPQRYRRTFRGRVAYANGVEDVTAPLILLSHPTLHLTWGDGSDADISGQKGGTVKLSFGDPTIAGATILSRHIIVVRDGRATTYDIQDTTFTIDSDTMTFTVSVAYDDGYTAVSNTLRYRYVQPKFMIAWYDNSMEDREGCGTGLVISVRGDYDLKYVTLVSNNGGDYIYSFNVEGKQSAIALLPGDNSIKVVGADAFGTTTDSSNILRYKKYEVPTIIWHDGTTEAISGGDTVVYARTDPGTPIPQEQQGTVPPLPPQYQWLVTDGGGRYIPAQVTADNGIAIGRIGKIRIKAAVNVAGVQCYSNILEYTVLPPQVTIQYKNDPDTKLRYFLFSATNDNDKELPQFTIDRTGYKPYQQLNLMMKATYDRVAVPHINTDRPPGAIIGDANPERRFVGLASAATFASDSHNILRYGKFLSNGQHELPLTTEKRLFTDVDGSSALSLVQSIVPWSLVTFYAEYVDNFGNRYESNRLYAMVFKPYLQRLLPHTIDKIEPLLQSPPIAEVVSPFYDVVDNIYSDAPAYIRPYSNFYGDMMGRHYQQAVEHVAEVLALSRDDKARLYLPYKFLRRKKVQGQQESRDNPWREVPFDERRGYFPYKLEVTPATPYEYKLTYTLGDGRIVDSNIVSDSKTKITTMLSFKDGTIVYSIKGKLKSPEGKLPPIYLVNHNNDRTIGYSVQMKVKTAGPAYVDVYDRNPTARPVGWYEVGIAPPTEDNVEWKDLGDFFNYDSPPDFNTLIADIPNGVIFLRLAYYKGSHIPIGYSRMLWIFNTHASVKFVKSPAAAAAREVQIHGDGIIAAGDNLALQYSGNNSNDTNIFVKIPYPIDGAVDEALIAGKAMEELPPETLVDGSIHPFDDEAMDRSYLFVHLVRKVFGPTIIAGTIKYLQSALRLSVAAEGAWIQQDSDIATIVPQAPHMMVSTLTLGRTATITVTPQVTAANKEVAWYRRSDEGTYSALAADTLTRHLPGGSVVGLPLPAVGQYDIAIGEVIEGIKLYSNTVTQYYEALTLSLDDTTLQPFAEVYVGEGRDGDTSQTLYVKGMRPSVAGDIYSYEVLRCVNLAGATNDDNVLTIPTASWQRYGEVIPTAGEGSLPYDDRTPQLSLFMVRLKHNGTLLGYSRYAWIFTSALSLVVAPQPIAASGSYNIHDDIVGLRYDNAVAGTGAAATIAAAPLPQEHTLPAHILNYVAMPTATGITFGIMARKGGGDTITQVMAVAGDGDIQIPLAADITEIYSGYTIWGTRRAFTQHRYRIYHIPPIWWGEGEAVTHDGSGTKKFAATGTTYESTLYVDSMETPQGMVAGPMVLSTDGGTTWKDIGSVGDDGTITLPPLAAEEVSRGYVLLSRKYSVDGTDMYSNILMYRSAAFPGRLLSRQGFKQEMSLLSQQYDDIQQVPVMESVLTLHTMDDMKVAWTPEYVVATPSDPDNMWWYAQQVGSSTDYVEVPQDLRRLNNNDGYITGLQLPGTGIFNIKAAVAIEGTKVYSNSVVGYAMDLKLSWDSGGTTFFWSYWTPTPVVSSGKATAYVSGMLPSQEGHTLTYRLQYNKNYSRALTNPLKIGNAFFTEVADDITVGSDGTAVLPITEALGQGLYVWRVAAYDNGVAIGYSRHIWMVVTQGVLHLAPSPNDGSTAYYKYGKTVYTIGDSIAFSVPNHYSAPANTTLQWGIYMSEEGGAPTLRTAVTASGTYTQRGLPADSRLRKFMLGITLYGKIFTFAGGGLTVQRAPTIAAAKGWVDSYDGQVYWKHEVLPFTRSYELPPRVSITYQQRIGEGAWSPARTGSGTYDNERLTGVVLPQEQPTVQVRVRYGYGAGEVFSNVVTINRVSARISITDVVGTTKVLYGPGRTIAGLNTMYEYVGDNNNITPASGVRRRSITINNIIRDSSLRGVFASLSPPQGNDLHPSAGGYVELNNTVLNGSTMTYDEPQGYGGRSYYIYVHEWVDGNIVRSNVLLKPRVNAHLSFSDGRDDNFKLWYKPQLRDGSRAAAVRLYFREMSSAYSYTLQMVVGLSVRTDGGGAMVVPEQGYQDQQYAVSHTTPYIDFATPSVGLCLLRLKIMEGDMLRGYSPPLWLYISNITVAFKNNPSEDVFRKTVYPYPPYVVIGMNNYNYYARVDMGGEPIVDGIIPVLHYGQTSRLNIPESGIVEQSPDITTIIGGQDYLLLPRRDRYDVQQNLYVAYKMFGKMFVVRGTKHDMWMFCKKNLLWNDSSNYQARGNAPIQIDQYWTTESRKFPQCRFILFRHNLDKYKIGRQYVEYGDSLYSFQPQSYALTQQFNDEVGHSYKLLLKVIVPDNNGNVGSAVAYTAACYMERREDRGGGRLPR